MRTAVPSRIHDADNALGTYCEWQSPTMLSISNAWTFAIDAVDRTSSVLITPLTVCRIESKTDCGTSLRAAATRHME